MFYRKTAANSQDFTHVTQREEVSFRFPLPPNSVLLEFPVGAGKKEMKIFVPKFASASPHLPPFLMMKLERATFLGFATVQIEVPGISVISHKNFQRKQIRL